MIEAEQACSEQEFEGSHAQPRENQLREETEESKKKQKQGHQQKPNNVVLSKIFLQVFVVDSPPGLQEDETYQVLLRQEYHCVTARMGV